MYKLGKVLAVLAFLSSVAIILTNYTSLSDLADFIESELTGELYGGGGAPEYLPNLNLPTWLVILIYVTPFITLVVTTIGTISTILIGWRDDRRKVKELRMKMADLELKLTDLQLKRDASKSTGTG